jgi:hypothetical protein
MDLLFLFRVFGFNFKIFGVYFIRFLGILVIFFWTIFFYLVFCVMIVVLGFFSFDFFEFLLGCFCWGLVRAFMLLRYCLEFLVFLIFVF